MYGKYVNVIVNVIHNSSLLMYEELNTSGAVAFS